MPRDAARARLGTPSTIRREKPCAQIPARSRRKLRPCQRGAAAAPDRGRHQRATLRWRHAGPHGGRERPRGSSAAAAPAWGRRHRCNEHWCHTSLRRQGKRPP